MLSVFLIWIYICLTSATIGSFLLRKTSFRTEDRLMFGLMTVTVYAEAFSLVHKVGLLANAILIIACIVLIVLFRKKISDKIGSYVSGLKKNKLFPLFIVLAVLYIAFMAYGSSRGYFHDDSDLYHGQAIRWIEEYGIVKGLGNLHVRLAYNSASFALSALYSFSFFGGQSYHAVAGFIVTVMLASSFRVFVSVKNKKIGIADFARLGVIYYCFNIYDEMVSPASDYFAMLFFMYVIVKTIELCEAKNSQPEEYAAVAMMAVFTTTVKLSAAPVILSCVVPIILLAKEGKAGKIAKYAAYAVVIILPYFVREYIISGRLFYPSTAFDVFSPVWKIPERLAIKDSEYIIAYGRGYNIHEAAGYPFSEWFIHWVGTLSLTEKVLFILCCSSVLLLPLSIALRRKFTRLHMSELICVISFLFWLFTAPLIRYGQGFLLILPAVMAGDLITFVVGKTSTGKDKEKKHAKGFGIIFLAVAVLLTVYKLGNAFLGFRYNYAQGLYLNQLDYGNYEVVESNVDGVTIYESANIGKTGYDPFPAVPYIEKGLRLIGSDIKSGFYIE